MLALCADGFGLAPGISAGIARLAHAERLTAVGCVTNSPHWEASAALLKNLPHSVDVGLHLNFTHGRPLSSRLARRWPKLPALPRLLAQAQLRLLPLSQVRNEVHAQLAAFNHTLGRPPAFIAGHRHVHHLPGLRQIILDMVEHVQPIPAVRNTGRVLGPGAGLARWLIER
ncbi:MAG: ChbG/HpnK family deacetylase, partial [Rhizobiales bacterium]|nr:ChbG/HpnK family deacetylase [Rhizobacter sp.]